MSGKSCDARCLANSLTFVLPRPGEAARAGSPPAPSALHRLGAHSPPRSPRRAAASDHQLTMIESRTATTTVFINRPSTLCTLTSRRIEVLTMVVSVVPNVAEQPMAR
jgi:hypothetical protein